MSASKKDFLKLADIEDVGDDYKDLDERDSMAIRKIW